MNEKVKQVFKKLCENYVRDINQLKGKKIAQDYFYNPEYEVEYNINGEWVATADILKAFDSMEELIKSKDKYIAKLCNDRAELKAELKELREFAKLMINNIQISNNRVMSNDITINHNFYNEVAHKTEFDLVKKVVEKYGKIN